jgi:hypothetical protein
MTRMNRSAAVTAILIFLFGVSAAARMTEATASSGEHERAATAAAASWLAGVDAGRYPESWDEAAAVFRAAVEKGRWEQQLRAVRAPLGRLLSRQLKSAQATTALPGAPDGHYVVLQFETRYEHKQRALETVTPMRDPDGVWRVAGYFIR